MDELDRNVPATGEWECMECGYIEKGVETRKPKKCPECDAPASALEFFSCDEEADDWEEDEDEDEDEDESEDEDNDEVEEY
jgi:hypothetical protein